MSQTDPLLNTPQSAITFQAKGKKPLFVQFVLENVWAVYDAVLINRQVRLATVGVANPAPPPGRTRLALRR